MLTLFALIEKLSNAGAKFRSNDNDLEVYFKNIHFCTMSHKGFEDGVSIQFEHYIEQVNSKAWGKLTKYESAGKNGILLHGVKDVKRFCEAYYIK